VPEQLHILLPTDVFPPVCGGAGWSAHALARTLQERGHRVTAIVPRPVRAPQAVRAGRAHPAVSSPTARVQLAASPPIDVLGVPTVSVPYVASRLPFVANWYRHEWLWPAIRNILVREALRPIEGRTVIHAQHVQSVPGAVLAGHELGVPVVATVRDHWPRDYFATGLHADRVPYPTNTAASLLADLPVRLGPVRGVLASVAIPYMLGHLHRRQVALAEAHAVVAVSRYIARHLTPIVPAERIHVLPNIVDVDAIRRTVAPLPDDIDIAEPFLLFVGKLERNKGAHLLPEVLAAAQEGLGGTPLPELIVAGSGSLAGDLRRACAERGLRLRMLDGWTDHDTVLRLMHHAAVLIAPSTWGEPLARVLLEASAAGACIAAMPTGGTPEIVDDGINGLLRVDAVTLGRAVAMLLQEPDLRARLRAGALGAARSRWAPEVVGPRFEDLYLTLVAGVGGNRKGGR
jgi:glycosyltransferase involved in cell wall biosynthesis